MIDSAPPPLDLTLAVVGKRRIDRGHLAGMKRDLAGAFDALAEGLRAAAGDGPATLALITGLADGADQIASALFLDGGSGAVTRVLGAVLPCPADEYLRNGPVENRVAFERLAHACTFVATLKGRLRPTPPDGLDTEIARQALRARGDAFAAQADALLRDAGILLAIDDPEDAGDVGGTRHTLHRALSRGLPVILIHLGRPGVSLPRLGAPIERDETLLGDRARTALAALAHTATTAKRSATKA
jgi:hypothetical protein